MDIRNVTEFRNFVITNNLSRLSKDIEAVAICVADYERGCACWKEGDRQKIYNNCKALYIRAISAATGPLASAFRSHSSNGINFYQDGVLLNRLG